MPITIKKKLSLKKLIPQIKNEFVKPSHRAEIVELIQDKIQAGNSPVAGKGRFVKYSKQYANKKGKSQPVDMTDSGEMLFNDLKSWKRLGKIGIRFDSKIAKYHNEGEGRNPERRLLPTRNGEIFKKGIMNKVRSILKRAVKTALKKQ